MGAAQSQIYICKNVNLNSSYEHTIYFPSRQAQKDFFASKAVKSFFAYSFLRRTWPIKVMATMEEAQGWSYLYFRNSTNHKTYYYFIDSVEYISETTVQLNLEMDVLQTYLFDWNLLPCFIERQHTETDNFGEHTLDEGLEVGDLKLYGGIVADPGPLCIMVMCTINPNAMNAAEVTDALPYMYNGVFSGVKIWAIPNKKWVNWGVQLDALDTLGQADSIISMWMYPQSLVKLGGESTWDDTDLAKPVEAAVTIKDAPSTMAFPFTGKVDGYTPRNKKVLCYPYNFIYATNHAGTSAVYRLEAFPDPQNATFLMCGSLSADGGVMLVPDSYNGCTPNYHEGIFMGGYPTCAWDTDYYKVWLAQNQNQHALAVSTAGLQVLGGAAAGIGGLLTGNLAVAAGGAGTAISGASRIGQMIAQQRDMEIMPPQARGNLSASVNIANGQQIFGLYQKSVTAERARVIDDYFTMYGYKINRVQTPNLAARPGFTYVKTVGCHVIGGSHDICNEDALKIESIFDKGVTWWRDPATMCNYNQDNAPTATQEVSE